MANRIGLAAATFLAVAATFSAGAQTPLQTPLQAPVQAPQSIPTEAASLGWMAGYRVHTTSNGSKIYESFLGPVNGVVTGTALTALGPDRVYTEYHRIGPNSAGVYGLSVANTRSALLWTFVPLKSIEPGRVTFQSEDGALSVSYYSEPGGGVGSRLERTTDGKTRTMDWHFKPATPGQ